MDNDLKTREIYKGGLVKSINENSKSEGRMVRHKVLQDSDVFVQHMFSDPGNTFPFLHPTWEELGKEETSRNVRIPTRGGDEPLQWI